MLSDLGTTKWRDWHVRLKQLLLHYEVAALTSAVSRGNPVLYLGKNGLRCFTPGEMQRT